MTTEHSLGKKELSVYEMSHEDIILSNILEGFYTAVIKSAIKKPPELYYSGFQLRHLILPEALNAASVSTKVII